MRAVAAGDREVDRCMACGALWFDAGEIRELTDGRVPLDADEAQAGRGSPGAPAAAPPGQGAPGVLVKMHREAKGLACPRCGGALRAIDFQMTGVPVLLCLGCRGYLAPRTSAAAIHARFGFFRQHQGEYAAIGKAMAGQIGRRMGEPGRVEARPAGPPPQIPLPVLVPLRDD
ncbi:MAG: hypothetical protein ACM31I_10285, partial [Deltaproteobacteria bacterium]